jgi:hypothetical protein
MDLSSTREYRSTAAGKLEYARSSGPQSTKFGAAPNRCTEHLVHGAGQLAGRDQFFISAEDLRTRGRHSWERLLVRI